jgi:hemerythrin
MTFIEWKPILSVNIKEIDNQHQRLINLINTLHEAMSKGKGRDVVGQILSELLDYTRVHFAYEEKLLNTHAYPGYVKHKAEHDTLTRQVVELHQQYQSGQMVMTLQVMNFLKTWLSNHIQGTDKGYSLFLNNKGVN